MVSFSEGDHLVVRRKQSFNHHGIYVGGVKEEVVDYSGKETGKTIIRTRTLEEFSRGNKPWVFDYASLTNRALLTFASLGTPYDGLMGPLPPEIIVIRALSQLEEDWYNPIESNCEHFAHWCAIGASVCTQTDGILGAFMPGGTNVEGKAIQFAHRENKFNYLLYLSRDRLNSETINFIKRNPFLRNYVYYDS